MVFLFPYMGFPSGSDIDRDFVDKVFLFPYMGLQLLDGLYDVLLCTPFYSLIWDYTKILKMPITKTIYHFLFPYMGFRFPLLTSPTSRHQLHFLFPYMGFEKFRRGIAEALGVPAFYSLIWDYKDKIIDVNQIPEHFFLFPYMGFICTL